MILVVYMAFIIAWIDSLVQLWKDYKIFMFGVAIITVSTLVVSDDGNPDALFSVNIRTPCTAPSTIDITTVVKIALAVAISLGVVTFESSMISHFRASLSY